MINRNLAHLWRQMKIHRILTHVCLYQIGCLCYCCYAKTSSSAVQERHSKVYGNPIAPSFYSILLATEYVTVHPVNRSHSLLLMNLVSKCTDAPNVYLIIYILVLNTVCLCYIKFPYYLLMFCYITGYYSCENLELFIIHIKTSKLGIQ